MTPMRQQLVDLRAVMEKHGVDYCLVPSNDFHGSEYLSSHFKARKWVSGFTGSAGTLLVGKEWAGLWTDGRYFLQAADQLAGTGIDLQKMGEPGVPTLNGYLEQHLQKGQVLAFDGRVVSTRQADGLRELADKCGASIACENDLVGEIWTDRPALSAEPAFELAADVVGKSRAEKLMDLRAALAKEGADAVVIASLMDVCWLMNLRGADVACTPVMLSFAAVTADEAVLFVNPAVLSDEIRRNLENDGVTIRNYEDVYDFVRNLADGCKVMMNLNVVNSKLEACVPQGVKIIDKVSPTNLPKACKNEKEVDNFRIAHIKDGAAVTKFMRWVKTNVGKIPMDEISVAEKLEEFRKEQPGYICPSFEPIMGYGAHGAIVHYSATKESCAKLEAKSFLLSDTGAHFIEGSTDITRTYALGELTDDEKRFYTLVLKGNLQLGNAQWKAGCTGANLDYLAREPLWRLEADYNHGTGHGVGYILSVHEGPQSIHWGRANTTPLEVGMITSNEPGFYLEGAFGVRLENLTAVKEVTTNGYGRFLRFETLTMVPFDLDAIIPELLGEECRGILNAYHAKVRKTLAPYMTAEENVWLADATRAI
ncbi:MAG: aminopeptidase P family protein [Clostridia bacterium]|nr:aminopeptidase P family protein [Clostridia bacterium]